MYNETWLVSGELQFLSCCRVGLTPRVDMRTFLLFSFAALAFCAKAMAEENEALRVVAQSTGEFSNNFLKVVAAGKSGNIITSPMSVQIVSAMAAYGAGGSTAVQMRSTLRLPQNDELGQSGYKSLIESLNNVTGVELRLANRMYTGLRYAIKSSFKELTASKFFSTSQEIDFANSVAAANTINAWCEEQTNHRIKDVVSSDSLDGDTAAVLLNAVYFKGQWKTKFNSALTQDKPFHVDARTTKNVPTMYIKGDYRFGTLEGLSARFLELPYQGDQMSMIIILPNEVDGLSNVLNNLHQVNLGQALRHSYPREVEVSLPKFKIESELDLKETMQKMGMTEMFTNAANFSGISDVPLKVSKIIQKAFIEVNEEGSEAAAVTGIKFAVLSAWIPEEHIFSVDRPAIYMIYDLRNDVTLFNGHLRDPIFA